MNTHTSQQDSRFIVYDADAVQQPDAALFDPAYWKRQGAIAGTAKGRGRALYLVTEMGPAVLRQYLRGGWPARVSRDRYVFAGHPRSRPVREFHVLAELAARGLPCPAPLAALCQREGGLYTGWLLMRRIMHAGPLAELVQGGLDNAALWRDVGSCIRRFHDHGVVHADLNARNILVGNGIHLIDFDRARIRPGDRRAFEANLRRLRRSLARFMPGEDRLKIGWERLMEAYSEGGGAR